MKPRLSLRIRQILKFRNNSKRKTKSKNMARKKHNNSTNKKARTKHNFIENKFRLTRFTRI